MNEAETAEGSSCKRQENGDASNESERPLKKARYAWQVKGKYHLKNETNDTVKASSTISQDPDAALASGSGSSSNSSMNTEQKLEILGDYLMEQDFKTLDRVISAPDKSVTPSTIKPTNESLPCPRYTSSNEQNPNSVFKTNGEASTIRKPHPYSMVVSENYTEDQCIARWQIIQMVRGLMDNTINQILDFEPQPLHSDEDSFYYVAQDVADFINNLPGDHSVENEGILMAISAHGLQHYRRSYTDINIATTSRTRELMEANNILITSTPSEDESHESSVIYESDTDTLSNDLDMLWSEDDQKTESSDNSNSSDKSYQSVTESPQNSSTECDVIENPGVDHCDFVDEAILLAIQSKGLTTFGSDYG